MLVSTQNHELCRRYGAERAAKIIIDAGFSAIDFTFYSLEDARIATSDEYKSTAKRLKADIDSLGAVYNQAHAPFGKGYDNYITNFVPHFPRIFEFASLLGVKTVVVHPIKDGVYKGKEEELFYRSLEFYKSLAPYAKSCGIKIGIENMWQRHLETGSIVDDILADPVQLARMYDELSDPGAFTVCLDVGHVPLCGREPWDAIYTLGGDRLGALHIHDVDYKNDSHTLPGMEKINWDKVIMALADINYQGDFTLEADNFLVRYPDALIPDAECFMAKVAKHYADKLEFLKNRTPAH